MVSKVTKIELKDGDHLKLGDDLEVEFLIFEGSGSLDTSGYRVYVSGLLDISKSKEPKLIANGTPSAS